MILEVFPNLNDSMVTQHGQPCRASTPRVTSESVQKSRDLGLPSGPPAQPSPPSRGLEDARGSSGQRDQTRRTPSQGLHAELMPGGLWHRLHPRIPRGRAQPGPCGMPSAGPFPPQGSGPASSPPKPRAGSWGDADPPSTPQKSENLSSQERSEHPAPPRDPRPKGTDSTRGAGAGRKQVKIIVRKKKTKKE